MDPSIHSFVIRIWLEETAEEASEAVWRGHVTHTASGERHFLRNLNEISPFIWPHLKAMGVKPPLRYQFSLWLREQRAATSRRGRESVPLGRDNRHE